MTVPDCIIAGAGPTGLTLALELARRGKTVRIFDRSPGTRPDGQSRALGILPSTLQILKASGVTQTLLDVGLRIDRVGFYYKDSVVSELDIGCNGGEFPFLLSLPQARTEQILEAALRALGVEVEWNTQITGLSQSSDTPALIIEKAGRNERVEGACVVGCDGVRSVVRKGLDLAFDGDVLETSFSLADVSLKAPPPPGSARVDLHDTGAIIQLPMPGQTYRLIATRPEVHLRSEISKKIATLGWFSDFEITFRHVKQMQEGKVFLAGDAAHVHSPAGGRGMNTGIGDAAWLAWLISVERQDEYQAMRLPEVEQIIKFTRGLTNAIASDSLIARNLRRWALPFALRFDFVQRRAAARMLAHDMPRPPWIDDE